MALADLLRFVFVAAIVTLYTTGLLSPALIVVFTLATSTVEAFRLPAGGAILPQLLEKEYYTLGKAANYSVSRISGLVGYMLAGGVIALIGAVGALWIDAATFLISSAIIWSIRYKENLQGAKQTVKGVIQDFAEGFRFIRASRTIQTVSLIGLLINFGIMPLTVFQTPYVSDYLKMGPETLSYIKILTSVGMITGSALLPKLGKIKTPVIAVAAGVIISFQACRGEIIAIAGVNGAGKSTLARMLCGLQKNGSGTVLWAGKPMSRRLRRKKAYMVMQDVGHQLFTDSVSAECALGIKAPNKDEIDRTLEKVDLLAYKERHPLSLSGGQMQRLAVVVSDICGKELLVFDEPTSGLDLKSMEEVGALTRSLATQGKVILIITHDIEFMMRICTRILFIQDGEIVEDLSGGQKEKIVRLLRGEE